MRKRGFTLVELLITIALLGMVIMLITNMLIFGMRAHDGVVNEFDVQSQVRYVTERVNTTIRDASGAYLLHKDYPMTGHLTEGWNYLRVNDTKDAIVQWIWSPSEAKHNEVILASGLENVTYDLIFSKDSAPDEDRLLNYELKITVQGREIELGSTLQSVNSLHVIDRSLGAVANTLAYRQDSRITDVGVAQAAVAMVLDTSGSMGTWDVDGKMRITVMKEETIKLVNGLAENDNIHLSLSPFNTHANANTSSMRNTMLPLKTNLNTIVSSIIPSLSAGGNTNTGDGMRRGFHAIKDFNDLPENADKTTKNFMIILVDGETNTSSLHERLDFPNIVYDYNPYAHTYLNPSDNRTYIYNRHYWQSGRWRFEYRTSDGAYTYKNDYRPVDHSFNINGVEYNYVSWNRWWGLSRFSYQADTSDLEMVQFVNHNHNVDALWGGDNSYYNNGRVFTSHHSEYVSFMGEQIKDYKNTRNDNISVYVIGFRTGASSGLRHIADSTDAIGPSDSVNYFTADTTEALKAVLEEIKFQINDKLWHIGGPN